MVVAFCNLAGAFGGSIAFGIGHANGAAGLEGFRWLFIIEGIITIVSAIPLWLWYVPRAFWAASAVSDQIHLACLTILHVPNG
jgi:hypothetical protein